MWPYLELPCMSRSESFPERIVRGTPFQKISFAEFTKGKQCIETIKIMPILIITVVQIVCYALIAIKAIIEGLDNMLTFSAAVVCKLMKIHNSIAIILSTFKAYLAIVIVVARAFIYSTITFTF